MRQPDKAIVTVCASFPGKEVPGSGGTNRANDALPVTLMFHVRAARERLHQERRARHPWRGLGTKEKGKSCHFIKCIQLRKCIVDFRR